MAGDTVVGSLHLATKNVSPKATKTCDFEETGCHAAA